MLANGTLLTKSKKDEQAFIAHNLENDQKISNGISFILSTAA